jgi:hypothetical protein
MSLPERLARKRTSSRPYIDKTKAELRYRRQFAEIVGKPPVSKEMLEGLRKDSDRLNYVMSVVGDE